MANPLVSIIIPAYKGGRLLCEAIQSVLDQTYRNLELIVVDDCCLENTHELVRQFAGDLRVRCIRHEQNRGSVAARQTGFQASSGEIVIFLDQDDLIHPEKVQAHVEFLENHPEIGVSYNGRLDVEYPGNGILGIWMPRADLGFADVILGYPFAPSDTVYRRKWVALDEIWDQRFVSRGKEMIPNGGEFVMLGRMALNGCKFGGISRALNSRRYHPQRVLHDLHTRCQAELLCQEMILSDPRCPEEVSRLRPAAFANTYLALSYYAFVQGENELGGQLVEQAVKQTPSLLDGEPCSFVKWIAEKSTSARERDHEELLCRIFSQLPDSLSSLASQYNWAVARGYLLRAVRAVVWGPSGEIEAHLTQARRLKAEADDSFLEQLNHLLLNYETTFGPAPARQTAERLIEALRRLGESRAASRLRARSLVTRAFRSYDVRQFAKVPLLLAPAIINDPRYLLNRGVCSILFRSVLLGKAS